MEWNITDDLPDLDDLILVEEMHILLPLVGVLLPSLGGGTQEQETSVGSQNESSTVRESVNSKAS